ncbi:FAD-dependent oxidoreductase [Rhodospirillales bacterium]|nr:FAD-dependent oxidoreductase [Rhodospirillales bacterium]
MARIAIFGGGIAGLYAAYELAQRGHTLILFDKAPQPGGLMRSFTYELSDGSFVNFDQGTHYLLLTGEPKIDQNLLSVIKEDEWDWYDDSLPEGHFYNGKLDESSGTLNLIDHPNNANYVADLLESPGDGHLSATLAESQKRDFGARLLKEVLEPITKKFTGQESKNIAPNANSVFANYRLKLVPGERSVQLKRSESFDRRLAYADRKMGQSTIRKGYPKAGSGMGSWVSSMIDALKDMGIEFATEFEDCSFSWENKKITAISWSQKGTAHKTQIDIIANSLSPIAMARSLNINVPSGPFIARNLQLHHYTFQGEYKNKDLHWITNFDPKMDSFRITLYENIAANETNLKRITVEVISDKTTGVPGEADTIWAELEKIGVIFKGCIFQNHFSEIIRNALPVFLPGWDQVQKKQAASLEDQIQNYLPLGQANGSIYGQIDSLKNIAAKLQKTNALSV